MVDFEIDIRPDLETLKEYALIGYNESPMEPSYVGYSTVWATAFEEDEPVYALYYGGTNRVVILERKKGMWKQVQFLEVKDWHGLLWRLCLKIKHLEETCP